MPTVASTVPELIAVLHGIASVDDGAVRITDVDRFRGEGIRDLAWTAAFTEDPATAEVAQWVVWEAAQELGARSASIHELYMARSRGDVSGFTVPAINIRAQTFDMARIAFETAAADDVGAVILELARSEQTYTYQRPIDYATACLAGAIAARWQGPVFLQGDHYQFNTKKYAADPESMTEEIRRACRLAIEAGYRNIDIDASTLVDLELDTEREQQRANYERTAELVALIRSLEPDGVTVSIGGEIGEVGKSNSTEGELRAYLDGLLDELAKRAPDVRGVGISKVSVQTGTSHGGMVMPDGTVGMVGVDFGVHERLGEVARRDYGTAGTVQHGASTLPDELFHRFREVETIEIHLATGFQNLLYEHPAFPRELHEQIESWCFANALDERKSDQTDQQFVYTTRKKALGPFKRQLWELESKDAILADQARKIAFLFRELGVVGQPGHGRSIRAPGGVAPPAPGVTARGRADDPLRCAESRSAQLRLRGLTPLLIPVGATPMLRARPGGGPQANGPRVLGPVSEEVHLAIRRRSQRAPTARESPCHVHASNLTTAARPARRWSGSDLAETPEPIEEELRGVLRDDLTSALRRLPELGTGELRFTALSGGITNRNFLVTGAPNGASYVVRLAGNDTHLLGISREVEHAATVVAAGVGVGPEVIAFLRPEGYLVTRFIEGRPIPEDEMRTPERLRAVGATLRRIHDGPAIPGLFVPFRIVEAYEALARARGVRIPREYELAHAIADRIELACLTARREVRPCHNDLLNANFIDDGARIRIVDWEYAGMGDPYFDLGNFSVNHELDHDADATLLAAYAGDVRPSLLGRLTLMRVLSDFREAMWGVLQQGISTLDVDFRAYAAEHFDRLLTFAAGPAFDRALEAAAGD